MTRLALLADIHGNLPALDAVLADLAQFSVDHVIVAGDVVNWGPFSAEVMARVTDAGWAVIRGNNEYYLIDHDTPRAPGQWREYTLIPWLKRQLVGRWHTAIATWPDTLSLRFPDAPAIRLYHGSPRSNTDSVYPSSLDAEVIGRLTGVEESTIILAHTHLPMDRRVNGWHVLNPGSVGVPLDGIFSASYMLMEGSATGWRATFRRVPFDYAPLFAEFERQGFVEECGVIAHLAMEEFRTARLRVSPFLHWRAAVCPRAPLTVDLLPEFEKADAWAHTPFGFHVNRNGDKP